MARTVPRLIARQLHTLVTPSTLPRCSPSRSSLLSAASLSVASSPRLLHSRATVLQNAAQTVPHTAAAGVSHPVEPTPSPPPPSSPTAQPAARHRTPSSQLPVKDRLNRKTSIRFSLADSTGSLSTALQHFARHGINLSRVESRPSRRSDDVDFYVDFQGSEEDERVKALMRDLRMNVRDVHVLEGRKVPWFPRRRKDLDLIANAILDAGSDLSADHPGFHDSTYRQRRQQIAETAMQYKIGSPIPPIAYTADETATWSAIWDKLMPLLKDHACAEHVRLLPLLMENCGYRRDNIPQIQDISDFLQECTGFILRPVAGLLSARNFLYGLAFRVFFSTQYLRHHSRPLYTPEPDLVHELLGHAPLFADQSFADFSQEIGLASIGATDDQITRLSRCYWSIQQHTFSVEFGLCKQQGQRKAYGAGLLSSFGELEYAMSDKPDIRPFDPFDAAEREYPITEYQPVYYEADSFEDAQRRMREYSESFGRLFHVRYNPYSQSLEVDGNVITDGDRQTTRK